MAAQSVSLEWPVSVSHRKQSKPDYGLTERDILAGVYQYDSSDHILTTQDGWMIRIEPGGRFIHC
jgi:hypothetical protein